MTKMFCDKCGKEMVHPSFMVPQGEEFPQSHSFWTIKVTAARRDYQHLDSIEVDLCKSCIERLLKITA